jgi:hypothetical protein
LKKIEDNLCKYNNKYLYYAHATSDGGYPEDLRGWADENKIQIISLSKKTFKNVQIFNFFTLFNWSIENRKKLRSTPLLIAGGFILKNIYMYIICRTLRIPYYFMPLSQYTQYPLSRRLFGASPIIKDNKLSQKQSPIEHYLQKTAFIYKKIFLTLIGRYFYRNANAIVVASYFEADEMKKIFKQEKLTYSYTFSLYSNRSRKANFLHSNRFFNIVYWGRVDYFNKGIDRILNLVKIDIEYFRKNKIRVHFLGPSYNSGLSLLIREIKESGISDICIVYTEKELTKIDFGGLTTADLAILLTRWEGFPRVVRECKHYEVPIIVSKETHYGDFRSTKMVFSTANADDPEITLSVVKNYISTLMVKNDR